MSWKQYIPDGYLQTLVDRDFTITDCAVLICQQMGIPYRLYDDSIVITGPDNVARGQCLEWFKTKNSVENLEMLALRLYHLYHPQGDSHVSVPEPKSESLPPVRPRKARRNPPGNG